MPREGFSSPRVKSIHTRKANEKSAPVAMTAPLALIQLLKLDRGLRTRRSSGVGSGFTIRVGRLAVRRKRNQREGLVFRAGSFSAWSCESRLEFSDVGDELVNLGVAELVLVGLHLLFAVLVDDALLRRLEHVG